MENFNDGYEEYTKRRDEAINKNEPFDENFGIKWNEFLVEEFWKRIEAYRFAVDYIRLWIEKEKKWDNLPFSTQRLNKIQRLKELIIFNFKNLEKLHSLKDILSNLINYRLDLINFPKFIDNLDLKHFNHPVNFEDTIFIGKVNFKNTQFYASNFDNSLFYEKADFSNAEFKNQASFEDSLFFKIADFSKSKFNYTFFKKTKFFNIANFSNSKFNNESNFSNTIFHTAKFRNVEFNKNIIFNETVFKKTTYFNYTNFNYTVDFRNAVFNDKAYFNNSIFNKETYFSKAKFNNSNSFNNVIFNNKAFFKETIFQGKVFFNLTKFEEIPYFNKTKFTNYTSFYKTSFITDINFNKTIFSKIIKFDKIILNKKIFINLNENTGKFILKDIELIEENKIEIKNLKTVNFIIEGINNSNDNFFFYDAKIINLEEYKNYLNKNNFQIDKNFITELKNAPNISIINSHLNKMKFINCDFSNAKNIHIENSDLTEVKFINTEWGEISEKRICPNLFEKEPKKARETYRQLKYTLDNQKDHINANEFFSLEMKAYGKSLKWNNWQYKIIFTINKWTSDFGQSWVKPLLWIFILTFIMSLYLHYKEINLQLIFNGNGGLNWSIIGSSFIMMIENFFSTLNIFKIFGNSNNNHSNIFCYHTITSIYTILLAFFIYQFIIAVKRKTKR